MNADRDAIDLLRGEGLRQEQRQDDDRSLHARAPSMANGSMRRTAARIRRNASTWNDPTIAKTTPYPNPASSRRPATRLKITPPIAPPKPTRPATDPTTRLGKRSAGSIITRV